MKHLEHCLYAAAAVSLGCLALWTIADLWLPLLILAGLAAVAFFLLGRKSRSG